MTTDKRFVDGYVADTRYPSMYHHRFAPPWIDSFLIRSRVQPPRKPRGAFTLVDAGCGDGYGLIVNAVAHPEGQFIGFDASAKHIARGRKLMRSLKLPNVELHRATLAQASFSATADYITAQGLLSWISRSNQETLWKFVSRTLKTGGMFAVGYNTLPGWTDKIPFQRLLRAFSDEVPGNSSERFAAGFYLASATGLVPDRILEKIEETMSGPWGGYIAHEYLNRHWDPLWSGDVIHMANAHNMSFVRTAMEQWVREDFAYPKQQRAVLARITNQRARETAADLFRNASFRTDLFIKPPFQLLTPDASREERLNQYWLLRRDADEITYACDTAGGKLRFANRAARAIVSRLVDGPARLVEIEGSTADDLLNAGDALFTAGHMRPADSPMQVPKAAIWNDRVVSDDVGIDALVGAFGAVGIATEGLALDLAMRRRLGILG